MLFLETLLPESLNVHLGVNVTPEDCSNTDDSATQVEPMSDNTIGNTRSRGRRSRRRKQKRNAVVLNDVRPVSEADDGADREPARDVKQMNYTVDYPENAKKKSPMRKSKSLDDEESVKITEVNEISEEENATQCSAVVSEVESDLDWDTAEELIVEDDLPTQETASLSEYTIDLGECSAQQPRLISPEDELNLRNFLEGLDLVKSPEECTKQPVFEKSSVDSIREKRAKKREALAQYFIPAYQNPRYLDVINEENSDVSDKEQSCDKSSTKNSSFSIQRRMQSHFCKPKSDVAILVPTKLSEIPKQTQDVCSTSIVETSSGAEIVYLQDTSSSGTPSESEMSLMDGDDGDDESSKLETIEDNPDSPSLQCSEHQEINETKDSCANMPPSSQLTPPPTPGNLSPKAENKSFNAEMIAFTQRALNYISGKDEGNLNSILTDARFEQLPDEIKNKLQSISLLQKETLDEQPTKTISVAALSPPPVPSRSSSVSSNGSSSRATSLCTARYNPSNSSLSDIASLVKDEGLLKDDYFYQPVTLRELCVTFLLTLPFGRDVLHELAEVSRDLELYTSCKYTKAKTKVLPAFMEKQESSLNTFSDVPAKAHEEKKDWVGLPTDEDPRTLLCLSPKQRSHLDGTRNVPDEAGKLLKLHENFLQRRAYHEDIKTTECGAKENIEIKFISNRHSNAQKEGDDIFLYYEDNNKPESHQKVTERSTTLPRTMHVNNLASARLQARNLNEWLQLARGKSTSDTHLNVQVPRNNHIAANIHNTPRADQKRRSSLPNELYQRQLQDILEKEREIQRELERLEDEKRKLQAEMAEENTKRFVPEEYNISKKGDIAVFNEKHERPTSMPAAPTEIFRQQMYEEYMEQIAARQERKHNKVIKLSTHTNPHQNDDQESSTNCEVIHVPGIEDEFMDEVKKRKLGGTAEEKEETRKSSGPDDEDEAPVLVLDGDAISGPSKLPKHLREFVDITRQTASDDECLSNDEGESNTDAFVCVVFVLLASMSINTRR